MERYEPKVIEPKWQKIWEETNVYTTDLDSDKPKYIGMSMFNYPSGAGIHIGHAMNYTISDVMARMKRQQGFESYHPVGWDSFGLPAENYAIKAGVSPQESMGTIIPNYHKQYKAMGWSNDWEKEIASHRPEYYKWTQWIFSEMYRAGLAYQEERQQWWCDQCQTVLANEQIVDGKCWRHDGEDDPLVEKRGVKQWFFKITEYADELLEAIDDLDWTESVKIAQRNWIGRSEGAEIAFDVINSDQKLHVFTTRPDTIFGATFMVVAPESDLVDELTTKENHKEVDEYRKKSALKSEVERQASKEKTGVFTGSYAVNPANGEKIPIWIADYVLGGYGTGAIMAVPAHDDRDNEFAKKFDIRITPVIEPTYGEPQGDDTHKDSIFVVLRNPKNDKIIVLDWGPRKERHGGNMLIGGGVEEGENIEETAMREIAEETGYTNVTLVKKSDYRGHGYFYSNTKNKNMHVSGYGLLFDLVDESQQETNLDEGERDKFKVTWQSVEKVAALLDDKIHETMYRELVLGECYTGNGVLVNSGEFDGMDSLQAKHKIIERLSQEGVADKKVNYKMRDWSVSRQRYWGAPIPIVYCSKDCGTVLIPDEQLPVVLPELEDFAPSGDGRSALARAEDWLHTTCPSCGGEAERETDTLDTYICSSWYMLRYLDPHNQEEAFSSERANAWMPIDFYNGADHATAHMLYARFITRFFAKKGVLNNPEPFKEFLFNGKVRAKDGSAFSKSKGNGVDPLEIIDSGYGADALRVYLMFAGPLELNSKWDPDGVPGTYRFLTRLYSLVQDYTKAEEGGVDKKASKELRFSVHSMIKKVTNDIDANSYNTAIASLMKCLNELYSLKPTMKRGELWQHALESFVLCLAPFAPHIADELWQDLGHSDSANKDHWPELDESALAQSTMTLAVQVNGKVRSEIVVSIEADEEEIKKEALVQENVTKHLGGKEPKKVIYVKNRLISIVV